MQSGHVQEASTCHVSTEKSFDVLASRYLLGKLEYVLEQPSNRRISEDDIQRRSELVTKNDLLTKVLSLRFVHKEGVVVDATDDHVVDKGQTVKYHQVRHGKAEHCEV